MDFSKYAHEFEKQMDEIINAMPKIDLEVILSTHLEDSFLPAMEGFLEENHEEIVKYLLLTPTMKAKYIKKLNEEERYILDLCALYSLQKTSLLFKSFEKFLWKTPTAYRECASRAISLSRDSSTFNAFFPVREKIEEKLLQEDEHKLLF